MTTTITDRAIAGKLLTHTILNRIEQDDLSPCVFHLPRMDFEWEEEKTDVT